MLTAETCLITVSGAVEIYFVSSKVITFLLLVSTDNVTI